MRAEWSRVFPYKGTVFLVCSAGLFPVYSATLFQSGPGEVTEAVLLCYHVSCKAIPEVRKGALPPALRQHGLAPLPADQACALVAVLQKFRWDV